MQTCQIDARSEPPQQLDNISIANMTVNVTEDNWLHLEFELEWSQPAIVNGVLKQFEVAIGPGLTAEDNHFLYRSTFSVSLCYTD